MTVPYLPGTASTGGQTGPAGKPITSSARQRNDFCFSYLKENFTFPVKSEYIFIVLYVITFKNLTILLCLPDPPRLPQQQITDAGIYFVLLSSDFQKI